MRALEVGTGLLNEQKLYQIATGHAPGVSIWIWSGYGAVFESRPQPQSVAWLVVWAIQIRRVDVSVEAHGPDYTGLLRLPFRIVAIYPRGLTGVSRNGVEKMKDLEYQGDLACHVRRRSSSRTCPLRKV